MTVDSTPSKSVSCGIRILAVHNVSLSYVWNIEQRESMVEVSHRSTSHFTFDIKFVRIYMFLFIIHAIHNQALSVITHFPIAHVFSTFALF